MALHQSQLDVLIDGFEWIRVDATLDETALTLSPPSDGFVAEDGGHTSSLGGWNMEKRVVRVVKQDGHGLGLSIQGGADSAGKPIVISKIFPAMAADQTGQLLVGDVILSVNGQSLVNARHEDAVKVLKRAGKIVNLEVQHREESLLRKEENLLQRLTWDDEDKLDPRDRTRSFLLKLAYVTRTCLEREDVENRTLEIRSHSARHTLSLRCRNSLDADAWFEAIHSCTETLGIQAQAQVNLILGQTPQMRRMGWLAERVPQVQGDGATPLWKPVFVGLTTNDLLFYDSVPAIKHEWASPKWSCPLIATRLVSTTARSFPVISGLSDTISFSMRTGTQEGVRTHLFRVETHRELAAWVCSVIQCTYDACVEIRHVKAPCMWQDQECELLLELDAGISLISANDSQVLWHHPFEDIRSSGDDGQYLWLDLGPPSGEKEISLVGSSPKSVVFILHSFLAAKVHLLGLYA